MEQSFTIANKAHLRPFSFLCCALVVCACDLLGGPWGSTGYFTPDENDLKPYAEKTLSVTRDGVSGGSVKIRVYEDLPSIPYISIADFHSMMLNGAGVMSEWQENGLSVIAPGGTAVVNPAEETFRCEKYDEFTNLMGLVQSGMDNAYLDGVPFIRYSHKVSAGAPPTPVVFDFKSYGIDLRADKQGVYFPFATLADRYSDLFYHYAVCNGEKVIIADRDSDVNAVEAQDASFSKERLLSNPRATDMAAFTYKELCFVVDHFYGMPGRSPYESSLKSFGMDGTLEASADGRIVKSLLLSTNPIDFAAGLDGMNIFLGDGGHSKMWTSPDILLNPSLRYMTDYPDLVELYRTTYDNAVLKLGREKAVIGGVRLAILGDENYYHKKGDTAFFHLDDFHYINYPAWRAYYAGTGPLPTLANITAPDQMVLFLDALKRAEEDPEVKNLVIDLTQNRGGSMDLVMAITSLIYGKSFSYIENVLTGERLQWFYEVDRNFDGKFDDADKDVHYNLNFGLLVGRICFSCGNLFPSLCKDEGLLLMGERCDGGGCGVGMYRTPEGIQYQISSARGRLTNESWENIDPGVVPQVLIEQTGPDISVMLDDGPFSMSNVTGFYNLDRLSKLMNEYY